MNIKEKVSYLKGLMEGMQFDTTSNEGKLIASVVEILDQMAGEINDIQDDVDELVDYVDELDHDLGDVEETLYNGDEFCDDDLCDEDDYDEDDDAAFIEVECPKCGEKIYFDDTLDSDEIICPNCNEKIETE